MQQLLIIVATAMLHAASSAALTAVTLDESRVGDVEGLNLNFAAGEAFAAARAALLEPANFGPGGIVEEPIDLATVAGFDDTSLATADLVVWNGGTLEEAELAALGRFVACGGAVIAFQNAAASHFGPLFGADAGATTGTASASTSQADSPVTAGPFGTLTPATVFPTGFAGSFGANLGATGVAAAINDVGTLAASFTLGAGTAVVFTDEEIFVSQGQSGVATARWSATTETLFKNAVAWLATRQATETLFCVSLDGKEKLKVSKLGKRKLDAVAFGIWVGGGRAVLIDPTGAGFAGDALDPKGKGLKFDVSLDNEAGEAFVGSLEPLTADFEAGAVDLDAADVLKFGFSSNKKQTKVKLKLKQKLLAPAEGRKGAYSVKAKGTP
ncbi:MAG: hypothetical protein ACR2PQ_08775 [Myxococcota bacterium]